MISVGRLMVLCNSAYEQGLPNVFVFVGPKPRNRMQKGRHKLNSYICWIMNLEITA